MFTLKQLDLLINVVENAVAEEKERSAKISREYDKEYQRFVTLVPSPPSAEETMKTIKDALLAQNETVSIIEDALNRLVGDRQRRTMNRG